MGTSSAQVQAMECHTLGRAAQVYLEASPPQKVRCCQPAVNPAFSLLKPP